MVWWLLVALWALAGLFIVGWAVLASFAPTPDTPGEKPRAWHQHALDAAYHAVVGLVCGFFDTLGIGNFAPTTSAFKFRGSVPDEKVPGTLNVGYALPTIAQALIYISSVEVDARTLVLMIFAAVVGAWLGAGVVANWPRRYIQVGMGLALVAAAGLMMMQQLKIGPPGGDALGLSGVKLWVGLVGNFVLGALMTLGVGLYGPCLVLVSLLGMNPTAAFPIMMGSCAFLMPTGGLRFIRAGGYSPLPALTLTVSAIPAVLVAAFLVKKMDLDAMRWLVVIVVLCTAALMLRSAVVEPAEPAPGEMAEAPIPCATGAITAHPAENNRTA